MLLEAVLYKGPSWKVCADRHTPSVTLYVLSICQSDRWSVRGIVHHIFKVFMDKPYIEFRGYIHFETPGHDQLLVAFRCLSVVFWPLCAPAVSANDFTNRTGNRAQTWWVYLSWDSLCKTNFSAKLWWIPSISCPFISRAVTRDYQTSSSSDQAPTDGYIPYVNLRARLILGHALLNSSLLLASDWSSSFCTFPGTPRGLASKRPRGRWIQGPVSI